MNESLPRFWSKLQSIQAVGNEAAGYNAWPCYDTVTESMDECHPPFWVSPEGNDAIVKLQDMCHQTVNRLMLDEDISEYVTRDSFGDDHLDVYVYTKGGIDASGLHPEMKQEGANIGGTILGSWFTILQVVGKVNGSSTTYFDNPLCKSSLGSRPLRLNYSKEDKTAVQAEIERLKSEIKELEPLKWSNRVTFHFDVRISMVDQKDVTYWVDETYMAKCPLCKKVHGEWDCDDCIVVDEKSLETINHLAASILHFGINCTKHLINLGYRQDIKTYNIRAHLKPQSDARKLLIQEQYLSGKGLMIDFVKQGMGTTHDGNTARRIFEDPAFAEEVLGTPADLVEDLNDYWTLFKASFPVCPDKVQAFGLRIRDKYKRYFPWGHMPSHLHKLLVHGHLYIRALPSDTLVIGQYSEENLEAAHKTLRRVERENSRQFSRKMRLTDVMKRMLDLSDMVILAPNLAKHRRDGEDRKPYTAQVLSMAKTPVAPVAPMAPAAPAAQAAPVPMETD